MSDAFECDRCGELGGGPPAIKVASNGDVGGQIRKVNEDSSVSLGSGSGRSIGIEPQITPGPKKFTRADIESGDLCTECAEEFRDWWNAEGS